MAYREGLASQLIAGLVQRAVVFLLLLFLMALLPRLLPGDPLALLLDSQATMTLDAAETRRLEEQFDLDGGIGAAVWRDVSALLSGDLGVSRAHGLPVGDVIASAFPWTALLILGAVPIFLATGVLSAIEAGRAVDRPADRALTLLMSLLATLPPFAAAALLVLLFAVWIPIFPATGAEPLFPSDDLGQRVIGIAHHAVLPTLALALHEVTRYYFVLRAETEGLFKQPFLQAARLRGVSGLRERRDYLLRNLMAAILARLSHSVSTLFSAVLFVEVLFSYPGVGLLAYQAILERDYILLEGIVAIIALLVLLLNWMLDAASTLLARRVS